MTVFWFRETVYFRRYSCGGAFGCAFYSVRVLGGSVYAHDTVIRNIRVFFCRFDDGGFRTRRKKARVGNVRRVVSFSDCSCARIYFVVLSDNQSGERYYFDFYVFVYYRLSFGLHNGRYVFFIGLGASRRKRIL